MAEGKLCLGDELNIAAAQGEPSEALFYQEDAVELHGRRKDMRDAASYAKYSSMRITTRQLT